MVGPGESGDTTGIWALSILGGAPRKLRDDAGRAAVSPDGSRIAYIATRAENEIWVMGTGGEQARKLLAAAPGERFVQLNWSPDGSRLAFLRSTEDNMEVASVPAEGGTPTRLLVGAGLRSFCWAADGRILHALLEPPPNDRDANLWELRVNRNGEPEGKPRRLTSWASMSITDLSVTSDGKRLVFVTSGFQTDAYVGELAADGVLGPPRRFTADERNDVPAAWSPDGQELLFYSDRNGNWDVFRQPLQGRTAQDFLVGPGEQSEPAFASRDWVLYWDRKPDAAALRLLRIPAHGGNPEIVLEAAAGAHFRCAPAGGICLLSEPDKHDAEAVFTTFAPQGGRGREVLRIAATPGIAPRWDLSPDGNMVAIIGVGAGKDTVRLIEWDSGSARELAAGEPYRLEGVAWAPEGSALFLAASGVRGSAILRLTRDGRLKTVFTSPSVIAHPLPAPDGKRLAFAQASHNSNAWMMEAF